MSHKSFRQECPTRVSYKSVPQECPTRVSCKSVPQECPASDPQECSTRVSHKSVPQECPTRVSHKSFLQEWPTRVSYRVSRKSVLQECPLDILVFRSCLHSGSWVPSCFLKHCHGSKGIEWNRALIKLEGDGTTKEVTQASPAAKEANQATHHTQNNAKTAQRETTKAWQDGDI